MFKNQNTSVAKAKRAIADYKKAVGQPKGMAELMVFFYERAVGFSNDVGLQDESYFDALVRMFDQACKAVGALPEERSHELSVRLDAVQRLGHNLGYGVGDDMDDLLAEPPTRRSRCSGASFAAAPTCSPSAGRARPRASRAMRRPAQMSGAPACARSRASSAATPAAAADVLRPPVPKPGHDAQGRVRQPDTANRMARQVGESRTCACAA